MNAQNGVVSVISQLKFSFTYTLDIYRDLLDI